MIILGKSELDSHFQLSLNRPFHSFLIHPIGYTCVSLSDDYLHVMYDMTEIDFPFSVQWNNREWHLLSNIARFFRR